MGSVPLMYQGSKYKPGVLVPIPTPPVPVPPLFVSAEVGTVDATTVAVTFDRAVQAAENDFLLGVTIKVNGSAATLISGIRQTNHAIVYYALTPAVISTDTVTWEYAAASGIIVSEIDGVPLADVTAQSVTNNVIPADPIGDTLRADAVAYWKMDEASGTRLDSTTHNNDASDHNTVLSEVGKVGNCATFEYAGTRYLTVANNADVQMSDTSFTIAGWFRFIAGNINARSFLSKQDFNLGTVEYKIVYGSSSFRFTCAGDSVYGDTLPNPAPGTWYFIIAQYDLVTQTPMIAINSAIFTNYGTFGPVLTVSDDLCIGGELFNGNNAFINGSIDELGIWRRLLSTDEINYLYNSGAGRALFP